MHERPDEILVAAARDGDGEAYAELARRHLKRVFAVCLALLGNETDAEDAVQEAFVKGLQKIRSLRDPARFGSWVDMIARNGCRDALRRRTGCADVPYRDDLDTAGDDPTAESDRFGDLRSALARLPEELRTALLMFYFDGKSTKRLAAELQLSQGGVCARLYRARRELRQLLEEEVGNE